VCYRLLEISYSDQSLVADLEIAVKEMETGGAWDGRLWAGSTVGQVAKHPKAEENIKTIITV